MTNSPTAPSSAKRPSAKPTWLTEALRAFSWHRRKIAAGCAIIAVFATLSALSPSTADSVDVVTAAKTLPAGTKLTKNDVRIRRLPAWVLPDEAILDVEQVLGKTVVAPLANGSILTSATLLGEPSASAGDGEQLVPIRVADTGVAALLRVGDHIRVIAVSFDGQQSVLANKVRVAALPQQTGSAVESGALIVVAADQTSATKLAGAAAQSKLGVVLV